MISGTCVHAKRRKLAAAIAGASLVVIAGASGSKPVVESSGEQVSRLVFGVPPPSSEATNPNRDMQPQDEFQLKPMYENLIGVDPETGAFIPMLAESWELTGNELRFQLRQGVQFHNDFGEMTAEDVVFSLQDLIDPPGAIPGTAEALRNAVSEFEIVSDYELVMHLENPNYAMFEAISYGSAGSAIKSKADSDSRGGEAPGLDDPPLAGTGPYQFLERTPGQNVVFERVPFEHWRQNGSFQELEYRYISENSTRLSALLAGEIHVTELPQELGDQAEGDGMAVVTSAVPGRRVGMSLLGCYYAEPPQPGEPSESIFASGERKFPDSPMCDPLVRQAINHAIDRDALDAAFYAGEAEPLLMWYWLPELPGWNPEWEEQWDELYGFDPDAARALLEEAGYGANEVSIEVLATPDFGGAESADVAEAVAGMLSDVGFDVDLVSLDSAQHTARREAREFQSAMEFDSTSSENITGFEPQGYANQTSGRAVEDVTIDTMYEAVLRELDPELQATMWQELGDVVFEAVQHVPLLRTYSEAVVDPNVVCGYIFPGANMSAPYSFVEYIEGC